MKPDIHPKYHSIKVKCACGTEFEVGSTLHDNNLSVEVCSNCHPFYTGQQKVVKTKRVEQFRKRYEMKPVKKAPPPVPVEEEKAVKSKPAKKKAAVKKPDAEKKRAAYEKKEAKKAVDATKEKKAKVTVKKKVSKEDKKKK